MPGIKINFEDCEAVRLHGEGLVLLREQGLRAPQAVQDVPGGSQTVKENGEQKGKRR